MKAFVVTCTIDESVFDDNWTNFSVVGCFYNELDADAFAREYEAKIREKHRGQIGWGSPSCEVHETILK